MKKLYIFCGLLFLGISTRINAQNRVEFNTPWLEILNIYAKSLDDSQELNLQSSLPVEGCILYVQATIDEKIYWPHDEYFTHVQQDFQVRIQEGNKWTNVVVESLVDEIYDAVPIRPAIGIFKITIPKSHVGAQRSIIINDTYRNQLMSFTQNGVFPIPVIREYNLSIKAPIIDFHYLDEMEIEIPELIPYEGFEFTVFNHYDPVLVEFNPSRDEVINLYQITMGTDIIDPNLIIDCMPNPTFPASSFTTFKIPDNPTFETRVITIQSLNGNVNETFLQAPRPVESIVKDGNKIKVLNSRTGVIYKLKTYHPTIVNDTKEGNGGVLNFDLNGSGLYYVVYVDKNVEIQIGKRINYNSPSSFDKYPHFQTNYMNIILRSGARSIIMDATKLCDFETTSLEQYLKSFNESQEEFPWYKRLIITLESETAYTCRFKVTCPPNTSGENYKNVIPFAFGAGRVIKPEVVIENGTDLNTNLTVSGVWTDEEHSSFKININGSQPGVQYSVRRIRSKPDKPLLNEWKENIIGTGERIESSVLTHKGIYEVFVYYPISTKYLNGVANMYDEDDPGSMFTQGWIKTKTMKDAQLANYNEDIVHLDGMGYPKQIIQVGGSPKNVNGKSVNIVNLKYYDYMRREARSYLPFVTNNSTSVKERYAFEDHAEYYRKVYDDNYPFTKSVYESSPLGRVIESYNIGQAYQSKNTEVFSTVIYGLNTSTEVYRLTVSSSGDLSRSNFTVNTLNKMKSVNEDGQVVEIFTDSRGNKVLERIWIESNDKVETYYVYDGLNRLRWVLSPEASKSLAQTASITKESDLAKNYCYQYNYDSRNRLIEKRIPGKGWDYMVYDKGNRVVMMQDALMRANNRWVYTVYDNLDRIRYQTIVQGSSTRQIIQDKFDAANFDNRYENVVAGGRIYIPFTDNSFSCIGKISEYVYGVYNIKNSSNPMIGYQNQVPSYLLFTPVSGIVENSAVDSRTSNLLVYEKNYIIDDSFYSTSPKFTEKAFYYDFMGRLVQVVEKNHLGGISRYSTKFDFSGNVLAQHESHQKGTNLAADVLEKRFSYDKRNRLLSDSTKLNNSAWAVVNYTYDELGRLHKKIFKHGTNFVEEEQSFNIQGWLVEQKSDLFEMRLRYYDPTSGRSTPPSYTGNITELEWKHNDNSIINAYTFQYDKLSRLVNTDHYRNTTKSNLYLEKGISYDKNGNIKTLQRLSNGSVEDNFTAYNYKGNQIASIVNKGTTYTYTHDVNGNCTKDGLQNLTLEYNFLNLIEKVKLSNTVKSNYKWLSSGQKLSAREPGTAGGGFEYLGSLIYTYVNGTLQLESGAFSHGRIMYASNTYTPNYFVKDHLGSVRVVWNGSTVVSRNDYYPFGGKWASTGTQASTNRFLYNGKELQTTGGLNYLDYGARMYDSRIGRWNSIDPAAELYYNSGSYNYCAGNPIKHIDIDGEIIGTVIGGFVGGIAGAYDAYKKGTDIWAGAAEGAVSGLIAGAAVDLAVGATVASGGTALVVMVGVGAAAGAVGGAVGAVAGDVTGQIVTNIRTEGVSNAFNNLNTDNIADKVVTGSSTGALGGALGAGLAKGLHVAAKSTKVVQSTMSKNIIETAETLTKMGADVNTVNSAVSKITTGMGELGKNTVKTSNKISVASGVIIESAVKIELKEEERKKQ